MPARLAGKIAIVAGAGQTPGETIGNGRAIALRFAQEGAEILCVDRDLARAQETAAMIAAAGGTAFAHQADISVAAECQAMVDAAIARWGRIDILVNNVGIGGGDAPAHLAQEPVWDRIMAVNLKASWLTIRAVIPVMRAAGRGAIVNISSLASLAGGIQIAYEISKAGVNRLTTSVATSNARYGVRCNAVLPGLIDTPMAVAGIAAARAQPIEEVRATRNERVPLRGRMGTAWDTANAALFLASDEANFITGVLLVVDGGMSVRIG
jgi:NAD(P)-dependent dehydrogenase (short-subunit alcohol dehydrogenase family)